MKILSTSIVLVGLTLGASFAAPVFAQTNQFDSHHASAHESARSLSQQADILGITVSDLQSRLDAGKSFAQIQKDLGLNAKKLSQNHQRMQQGQLKEHLDAMVAEGKLTQQKENAILARAHRTPHQAPTHHGKGKRK